ncbi:hypothetical protein BDQ12DRAFT_726399 [Crucibulum laeve]|uniref:Uncharacterized protein n=1 Tax=Crucibulum laeve TaxID=68775 RepID=A0A5C3LQL4_9AGAR|nr:hypothetical protein BDQ12DRAFT_726399 [Crucibulum laeve]
MSTLKSLSITEMCSEQTAKVLGALKISALSVLNCFGARSPSSSEQIINNDEDEVQPFILKSSPLLPVKPEVGKASQWNFALWGDRHPDSDPLKKMMHLHLSGKAETKMYRKLVRENLEVTIDWMQQQELTEPLNRETWRRIILDEYVDFVDFYATLDRDYPYTTRSISTIDEYERVFSAWEKGVTAIYPHRTVELRRYRLMVVNALVEWSESSQIIVPLVSDAVRRVQHAVRAFRLDKEDEFNWSEELSETRHHLMAPIYW